MSAGGTYKWRKVGRQQIANCTGYMPSGYCAGNPKYVPPNGNWAAWGLGFTAANTYGFTGALTNCSTVTVNPIIAANGNWNYCNCGANCTFYYVNCNCNCNCAGFCCFPKGTLVRRADGGLAPIETIDEGAQLAAKHGVSVVEGRIICLVKPGDKVFRVNQAVECTREQLFLSPDGTWLAVDLAGYLDYRTHMQQTNPQFGLADGRFRQLAAGDIIHTAEGLATVGCLDYRVVTENEELHSFVLTGTRTFFANDFLVESRVSDDCFNLSQI